MKYLISGLMLFFTMSATFISFSQTAIDFTAVNDNATFNTCNGFIIDSGGQGGGGYGNNESVTITICPDTPGEIISVVFNLFNLDGTNTGTQQNPNLDNMSVYDGPSTASNSLGVYNTNQLQGVVIEATALNASGCITLEFYSNSTGTGVFTASVSCETPCADPQAGGVIVGGLAPDSIRVCVGEMIDFQELGSFAQQGFNLVDYSWDFMDGTTANGQNVSHSYAVSGQYKVQLFVTDDNGCSNPNLIDLEVLVATYPDFSTFQGDTEICLGESLSVSADPNTYEVEWTGFPGSQSVDDGCLPDTLLGVSQDIQLLQTGFSAGSVIANVNDIQNICLDLEHSFMGDLVIMIECPNGQNAILHQQGGGGTQLGVPIPTDDVDCSDPATMGTPFTYCFEPGATETWVDWVANNPGVNTLPAGTYESIDPLTNLVGCPTNGVWTLTVIDNWAADDGTLFSFGLTLDPSYYPAVTTFTPDIGSGSDSSYWVNPVFQTSLSANGNDLTVLPTTSGAYTYEYFVENDFGCAHDTSFVLTVNDNPIAFAGNDTTICGGSGIQLAGDVVGLVSNCDYVLELEDTFGDSWNGNTITITINGVSNDYTIAAGASETIPLSVPVGATVTYTFNAIGNFVSECAFEVLDSDGNVIVTEGPNLGGNVNGNWTSNCVPDLVYEWTPANLVDDPTILDPTATINVQETLTLTVYPLGHPLCATTDDVVINASAVPDPGTDNALEVCSTGPTVDLFTLLGPTASPNGSWIDPSGNPVNMPYDPQTMPVGDFVYVVDSNGCIDQATITITEIITSITDVVETHVSCFGRNDGSFVLTGVNIDGYTIDGGTPVVSGSPFTVAGLSAGTYTVTVASQEGCIATQDVIIDEPAALTAISDVTDASCFGECDGSVIVTPSGGTTPYTYTWNGAVTGTQNGNATGICAGDYVMEVVDDNGCLVEVSYRVEEPENVFPSIFGDTLFGCYPHTVDFVNTTPSVNIQTTTVDFGDGNVEAFNGLDDFSHTYVLPGLFTVTVTLLTTDGCEYVVEYTDLVQAHNYPIADFTINPNNVSVFDPIVTLINQSTVDAIEYSWDIDGGNPNTSTSEDVENIAFPDGEPAQYPVTLIATNAFGCPDTVTKLVNVVNDVILYAPNTFTPDGDEFNQTWNFHILGVDIYDLDLFIYNRWGEVIWESHDPSVGWDGRFNGKPIQAGTYNWVIKCKDQINDDKYNFNGHITVIR